MTRPRVTKADVRRAYPAEKSRDERYNQWVAYFLVRPLSQRLAPVLVAVGIGPNAITLVGLTVSLSLPVFAWLPSPIGAVAVAVACVVVMIADCLDGDVARVSAAATPWGGYLDMVTDIVHRLALYLAIGLLALRHGGPIWAPLLAVLAAWLAMAARWCRGALAREPESGGNDPYARQRRPRLGWFDYIFFFLAGLDQLLPVAIVAAVPYGVLPELVVALFLYSLLDFGFVQVLARGALK